MPVSMKTKISESGPTPRRLLPELKRINLESATELGQHFHEVNLPRRFTVSGGIMLAYAARDPKYQKRKLARFGHRNPLEFSGNTKRDVLGTEDVRTSGTSRRWSMNLILNARNLNRFKTKNISPADELRRVADREHGPLERFFAKVHGDKMQAIR